jgi:shikimate kinase
MKIVLLGYMASGKSTVGNLLAKKMYVPFIDLDQYIEEKEKMTIHQIFDKKGEIYFRITEHKYLKELINSEENFILSLGGGTPCYAGNMDFIIASNAVSIYLQGSIPTIVNRLINGKKNRPLISGLDDDKITEFVAKHLFERRYFYEQASNKVKIDDKTPEEISTEIRILLH